MASSLTTSPKCTGSATGFSRNGSAGTFRSAATWKSTNSMRAVRSLSSAEGRRRSCSGLRAALADDRPYHAPRHVPGATGWSRCAGIRCHLGKQPLRRRSLHQTGENRREHRKGDVRTLRRHDRVRLDAAAHRYRHRDGRSNGADSLPRSLASETSRRASADRKNNRGRRLSRSVARAAFSCSGSRRSRQAGDRRGRRPDLDDSRRSKRWRRRPLRASTGSRWKSEPALTRPQAT
jgi:hypothetical protein